MNFALLLRHRSIEPVLTLLPSHSGLKLRNAASLRYMLQDSTKAGLLCRRQITRQVQASRGHCSLGRKRQPTEHSGIRIPVLWLQEPMLLQLRVLFSFKE